MSIRILQIVPRMFPDVDGVGDYALQLAHELCDRNQIRSDFLVFRPSCRLQSQVDGFTVHRLDLHTIQGLVDQVPKNISTIFLQYSNYPYLQGKLDTPMWLVDALKVLKQRGIRIVVMFHELPTLRYKWLRCPNFVQRRVSRGLAKVADVVVTNNTAFQQKLTQWTRSPVHCVPNFSTIGEVTDVKPLSERKRSLVVFGSSDRTRVYRNNTETLNHLCQTLEIDTLYDVGRPVDWDDQGLDVNVVRTGFLSAADVSELMAESMAGVFDYRRFPQNLAKSTVYAAYCSHGLLPICNGNGLKPQDDIVANHHYLVTSTLQEFAQPSSLQAIADNAYAHYRTRTLAECARKFAEVINPVESVSSVNTDIYTELGKLSQDLSPHPPAPSS
ncbi:MAG: glycosyltransferase family 4 protein [Leptolyngbya sp. SIO3F4]|nr:glycosyltransferase family 4 protein [Leptolyngbya sp. SIO3F4]